MCPIALVGFNPFGQTLTQFMIPLHRNTLKGSSGAPCFDAQWNLVALHHAGDPDFDDFHQPEYNQGIPIKAIHEYLNEQGITDILK